MTPVPLAPAWAVALGPARLAAAVAYALAQAGLVVYASHRYVLLWRWRRRVACAPGGRCEQRTITTAMATGILSAAAILVVLLIYRPATTWPGFLIVGLGIPVFLLMRRRS